MPFLEDNPNDAKALLIAAQAYLAQQKPDEAIEWLEKIGKEEKGKEVLHAFASAYNLKGKTNRLIEYLELYREAAPDDPLSYLALSRLYAQENAFDEAESQIRKLINRDENNADYHLLLCRFFLETGQEEKAENELKRLASTYPEKDDYKLAYGDYLLSNRKFKEASAVFDQAVQNDPRSWKARNYLVQSYLVQGKTDDALNELNAFLKTGSTDGKAEVYLRKGEILARLDRLEAARRQCDLAIEVQPANAYAYLLKGQILLKAQKLDDALTEFRQAVDLDPSKSDAHILLAKTLAVSGNLAMAIQQLKKGLQHQPGDKNLRMALIHYYKADKNWQYALEAVNAGLDKHPEDISLLLEKGKLEAAKKRPDKAETIFESVINAYPEKPAGYIELGRLKHATNDYEKAITLFKRALELNGTNQTALALLLSTYMGTGRIHEAEFLCREMLKEGPEDPFILTSLGSVLTRRGVYEEAEQHLKAAIRMNPHWERPHYELVSLYARTDRLKEAASKLQEIYAEEEGSLKIGFTLSVLYQELGEHDKAISILENLLEQHPDILIINNNLAYLYAEYLPDPDHLAKAVLYAQKALQQAPNKAEVLDTAALVEFKSGRLRKALEYAGQAVEAAQEDAMIHYHAGLFNHEAGNQEEAVEYLSQALKLGLDGKYEEEAKRLLVELRN